MVVKRLPERELRELVFPLLETLLAEMLTMPRKYVVFCGFAFEWLFQQYEKSSGPARPFVFLGLDSTCANMKLSVGKVRCKSIEISDWRRGENRYHQRALIAHTYPWRRFINHPRQMLKYGQFCYQTFKAGLLH